MAASDAADWECLRPVINPGGLCSQVLGFGAVSATWSAPALGAPVGHQEVFGGPGAVTRQSLSRRPVSQGVFDKAAAEWH